MIDLSKITPELLSNPAKMAVAMLDAMEKSDAGEPVSINDPNNGFVMFMMTNFHMWGALSQKQDYATNYFYPQRARTAAQLYPRLSEFDYVNLMASPATIPFLFRMSKDWIIANAVPFDENYNKIQIPATSYITMGGISYSMYYPIDIFVNRNTNAVSAIYNTNEVNGLNQLVSNMVLDTHEYQQDGLTYFQIVFSMFQFERKVIPATTTEAEGFSQSFSYDDQFYAAKVFYLAGDGTWTELAYSLDQMWYDYKKPTALLTILNDQSQVKIEIPQIYFNNGQISQNLRIEIYTTQGEVNYAISQADMEGISANFDTASSSFAAPLVQMPTWDLIPTVTEIAGGSNAQTFEQIRDAVVNNRLHSRPAVTTEELVEAGRKAGFSITRFIDDLTDRMYFASNILTDGYTMIIPTFVGSVLLKDESLTGNPSTIIDHMDGYRTILPTTVFRVADSGNTCVPLTNAELSQLSSLNKSDYVTALNTNMYLRQPFHITLLTAAKSPQASVYNLLSPTVDTIWFTRENPNSAPQMSAVACAIAHTAGGTGGYRLRFTMVRSANIRETDAGNFKVFLTCKTKLADDVYLPALYIGKDNNQNDVWEVSLMTNYHISNEDYLTVTMYNSNNTASNVEIPLTQSFNLLTTFIKSYDPAIPTDSLISSYIPSTFVSSVTAMSQQKLSITLGKNLSDQIYCGVNTTWGSAVYQMAEETIYYNTSIPIFQTNETGQLETSWDTATSKLSVVQMYGIGDTPSEVGNLVYKTTARSTGSGAPVVLRLKSTAGLLVGMAAMGTKVPVDAVVADIDGLDVMLSVDLDDPIEEGTEITFINPNPLFRTTADQTATGDILKVASTSDLLVGQSVFGFGLAPVTTVKAIVDATHFQLSVATTAIVKSGTLLTFINKTAPGVVKVAKGSVVKDVTGNPVILESPKNQFRIPSIMFDGRLFASDNPKDAEITTVIAERLQNYANQIRSIDEGVTEVSEVYYKPARTMGTATFGLGNNKSKELSLELSFSFTIYVDTAVYNTETILDNMRQAIYAIVNSEIQKPVISVSEIANVIKDKLGDSVTSVESGGINGDSSLRLIALEETDSAPSIEYKVFLQADGTIVRNPNVEITFVPKPQTVDTIIPNQL